MITQNPCFSLFRDCIGAVGSTHIHAFISVDNHSYICNHKESLFQNCLFICGFDFFFVYVLTGWDSLTADTKLWHDTHMHDLEILQGRYLLADTGFGTCDALLVPFQRVWYHLKEWHQANLRYEI